MTSYIHNNTGRRINHNSFWPISLAFALTIAMVGLIVHPSLILLGSLLSLVAMLGWTIERFQGPLADLAPATHEIPTEQLQLPALDVGEAALETPFATGRRIGWWGLVWFIVSEALFFANLIAGYLYLRISSPAWPPSGTPRLGLSFPLVNTAILLLSGIPALYAERRIERNDRRGLRLGLILAALLGLIFLIGQIREYLTIGITPQTNIFAAGFFALTGFHGAHVMAGIGLLLTVLVLSFRGHYSSRQHFGVQVATTYWHFVDVVWIFLFTILYLFQ